MKCDFCEWHYRCPCGRSLNNAACLTLFKPNYVQASATAYVSAEIVAIFQGWENDTIRKKEYGHQMFLNICHQEGIECTDDDDPVWKGEKENDGLVKEDIRAEGHGS